MLEINFFWQVASLKTSSKTYIPGSKTWRPELVLFPPNAGCQIYDQTIIIIDNAVDIFELCLVLRTGAEAVMKTGSTSKKLPLTEEFPGSNFLLPTFLQVAAEIFRWQISYMSLLISNSELPHRNITKAGGIY